MKPLRLNLLSLVRERNEVRVTTKYVIARKLQSSDEAISEN
jgi:hypothetical protein